jgi:hypothetical protein
LDDEEALDNIDVFPLWEVDTFYKTGDRRRYEEVLYRVLQDHTSQADWTPDVAVSLYVRVDDPGEEWPDWRQPTGAQDAYEHGAKVSHLENEDGTKRHWISIFEGANVWEPGAPGTESLWEEVS